MKNKTRTNLKKEWKKNLLLDRHTIDAIAKSLFFEVKLSPQFTKIKKDLLFLMLPTLKISHPHLKIVIPKKNKTSFRSQVDRWVGREQTDLLIRRVNKIAASLYA